MDKLLSDQFHILMRRHKIEVQNYLTTLGLYMGQPRVLFYLEEFPGISQKELSEKLDISKESISVSTRRLEKSGFILREESEIDRRVNLLKLTDKGFEVVKDLRSNFEKINNQMFVDLNEIEKKELKRIFEIMNASIEKRLTDEEII